MSKTADEYWLTQEKAIKMLTDPNYKDPDAIDDEDEEEEEDEEKEEEEED